MARNSHAWGPYTCKEFKSGEQCTFEALDNYWRQPKVGKVILKAIPESGNRVALLERGKIDIADLLLPKEIDYLQGRKGVKVFNVPNNLVFYLNMNSLKKPFDDIRVRQAMNYACPKEEILSSAFRGLAQPMKSCISQIFPDYTDRFWKYDYNPDKAARLLADAGYPQGFEIELTFSDYNAVDEEVAVIMRNALKKIKVDCKLRKLPAAAFMEKLFKKEHAFCVETECPIIPDPGYWATVFFEGNAFLNHSNIHDPELDKLIDSVRGTYDTKERLEFSKKIQERVLELAHKVFICCPGVQVAMRDDIGGNLHMGWVNSYHWEKLDKI
jgi:peptide/nickel transport system substrate-binding protein